jgi:hypothetical protein
LKDRCDGIIFTPGNPRKLDPIIHRLTAQGTAMLCVASDAPASRRIGLVSASVHKRCFGCRLQASSQDLCHQTRGELTASSRRETSGSRPRWRCLLPTLASCRRSI